MNCIIVDDNKMARIAIKQMVSKLASLHLVAECENPFEAINIIREEKIDLIFLDVEMPQMTGLEFLGTLEKHPLVILITAKPEYALEAFEHNVVDCFTTPFKEGRFI